MWLFNKTSRVKPVSETKDADLQMAVLANARAAERLITALGVTPEQRAAHSVSIERLLMSPLAINRAKQ